jgi:succinoglycan biosynthesis protein ExoO
VEMSISVVIPAYNAREFIHRSVSSVLGQTRTDWELVIVSDDGLDYERLLREGGCADSRLRYVSTGGKGTGPANARNVGLDAAQGRIIATLDADDRLAPHALERLAPLALEHGAAYSRPRFLDHETDRELESLDRQIDSGPVELEEILTSQIHTYAGIVFDRVRVGARWPSWMQRWEDVYFYVKCFDSIDRMYHLAEPLYIYYRREGSICNRPQTGEEYQRWAADLAARFERGESLELQNPAARAAFHGFLRSRHGIETAFMEALADGRSQDFQDFARHSRDLFHRLAS